MLSIPSLFYRFVGLGCVGLAFAQSTSPFLEFKRIPATSMSHVAAKRDVAVGDCTGDARVDMLLVDDGNLWLVYDVATAAALVDLEVAALDVALLAPQSTGTGQDIVVSNADGLLLLSDYDAGSYTRSPRPSAVMALSTHLQVADLEANGGLEDVVGIGAGGQSLVIAHGVRDGSPVFSELDLQAPVFDVAVADYLGDARPELLALLPTGLHVFDAGGTQLAHTPFAADSGHLVLVRQTGYGYVRCAAVFRDAGTTYRMVTDAEVTEASDPLGALVVVAVRDADVDQDGDSDLFLVGRSAADVYLSDNLSDQQPPGALPTFSATEYVPVGIGPMGRYQSSSPGLADFDGDADPDLLLYSAATDEFVYCVNITLEPTDQLVGLPAAAELRIDEGSSLVTLEVEAQTPAGKDLVEVLVWSQPTAGGPGGSDPIPAFHAVFPAQPDGSVTLALELGELGQVLQHVYNVDVRTVDAVDETIVDGGPSTLFAFALEGELLTGDELFEVILDDEGGPLPSFGPGGRELIPVVICIPDVPPFGDEAPSPAKPTFK